MQKAQQLRERMDKWDYIKFKSFCTTKETVSKLKKLLTEWEKIFASYTSDKGLIPRVYRELKNLNSPKINDPVKKWAKELNRLFQRNKSKWIKKHMKIIKEMQIKTTLRLHLTSSRMPTIKNTNSNKCCQGCEEKGTFIYCW
jgi:hypothetical protein